MSDSPIDALDPQLRDRLDRIPVEPGVYLMKDKKGRIIYIGKASSLRARVRSYFNRSGDARAFVALLDRLLGDVETVVTNNEKEALLLENNLIKQHQPRFNVKLVDDKNYLVLRLDPSARYPRLEVTRRIGTDGARYFGPYHSATSCRQTLHVVNRHFKLRTCSDQVLDSRSRPCLQYQIKRCDAPCVFPVPEAEYAEQVRDVSLFLEGKDQELVHRLRARMKEAAQREEFEVAASVRDQLGSLEKTLTEQRVVSEEQRDQDVVGFYREGTSVEIAVLHVRQGKLLGRRTFSFTGQEFPDEEIVSSFVSLYYDLGNYIPDEVLLHCSIEDAAVKAEWLRERRSGAPESGEAGRRGRAVEVLCPQRGARVKLVTLAQKNAVASFVSRRDQTKDAQEALGKMKERLGLKRLPRRIECYDISHIQGSSTVASMVVFLDGEPAKSEYRRFKVRSVGNDDFASMYEVLSRRFRRSQKPGPKAAAVTQEADDGAKSGEEGELATRWPMPDLVVIDGGKGQLGAALAALGDVGVDLGIDGIDVVGLAKERDEAEPAATEKPARGRKSKHSSDPSGRKPDRVFLPRIKDPIPLRPNTAELYVLSRIRDEAHRFAITFHRSLRRKRTLRSALGDVPGVGAKRQRELLRRFGSLKQVREASFEELAAAPGMTRAAAVAVQQFFLGVPAGAPSAPGARDAQETQELATADETLPDGALPPGQREAKAERGGVPRPRRKKKPKPTLPADDVLEDAATEELSRLLPADALVVDDPVDDLAPADEAHGGSAGGTAEDDLTTGERGVNELPADDGDADDAVAGNPDER